MKNTPSIIVASLFFTLAGLSSSASQQTPTMQLREDIKSRLQSIGKYSAVEEALLKGHGIYKVVEEAEKLQKNIESPQLKKILQELLEICKKTEEYKDEIPKYDWEIFVVDSPINFLTSNGDGKILVTTAFLEEKKNEDLRVLLVGHEMGHIIKRHWQSNAFFNLNILREHELDADRFGAMQTKRLGRSLKPGIEYYSQVKFVGGTGSTHPSSEKREAILQEVEQQFQSIK